MTERTLGTPKARLSRVIGLTAVVASLVLMNAAPAHAIGANEGLAEGGEGAEDSITYGNDFGDIPTVWCLEVTENTNTLHWSNNNTPMFNATNSVPESATYTKQADLTWSVTQTMYSNPYGGVYSAPLNPTPNGTGCDPDTLGDPIAASATVHGDTGPGSIDCASGAGAASFSRVDSAVTVSWTGTCTVTDDSGSPSSVTTPTVNVLYEGIRTPCISPPNSCESDTYDGTLSYS